MALVTDVSGELIPLCALVDFQSQLLTAGGVVRYDTLLEPFDSSSLHRVHSISYSTPTLPSRDR